MIEQYVPEVPDGQVKLADCFLNFPGARMAAHQPKRRFEGKSRGEQPVHRAVVHASGDAVVILRQAQSQLRRVACTPRRGTARRPYARLVQFRYGLVTEHA